MNVVVEARSLTKRYGDRTAVDRVDLTVRAGEVYGFLGPNGAGKTTTLRMLLGLIRPTSGAATVLGRPAGSPSSLARIGSMIEGPAFYPHLSGRDNLRAMARLSGVPTQSIGPALDAVDLSERAGDRFSSYSLGMKQRLGVAAALLKDPELVVLDEPTNGLDPAGMRDMRTLIVELGRQGRTVLLSSHLLAEVQEVCDRVAVIVAGEVVAESTVAELRGDANLVVVAQPLDRAVDVLSRLGPVRSTQRAGAELRLVVDDRHVAEIVRALVLADVDVAAVRREERQLEDVFFEITGSSS